MKSYKEKAACWIGEKLPIRRNPTTLYGYTKKIESLQYAIYCKPTRGKSVIAAQDDTIVIQESPTKIRIYPHASVHSISYKIELKPSTFPGLWDNSSILSCTLLPYMRVLQQDSYLKSLRLCLITDLGQIFHNYPARNDKYDGPTLPGDITRFEESVVWDLPDHLYPSRGEMCATTERYYPNLPETCYEYHPINNTNSQFVDQYKNGGFGITTRVMHNGASVEVSRFYQYARTLQSNPFHFIGTGERNYKLNLIGTYRSNIEEGVRTCVFASDDGGRQWYCKYEFADSGEYTFQQGHSGHWGHNFGNPILNADNLRGELEGDLQISKRNLVIPSQIQPSPEALFDWEKSVEVAEIIPSDIITFRTKTPHGLLTGNIVALTSQNVNRLPKQLKWMLNTTFTPHSSGNGLLFKVECIADNMLRLYELVSSPNNNIPCRHIHHINRVKDGWMIGTGEIYPNSWMLYFQMKQADTYTICHASDEFLIVRLNSSENSIQRTMGSVMFDDYQSTLFYASDHDESVRSSVNADCVSSQFSRSSTGLFYGKLCDINQRDKFMCVYEAAEPCFYFQRLDSMYVFCGQRGELGLCMDDNLMHWKKERIDKPIIHYYGNHHQYYFFDNVIIRRK